MALLSDFFMQYRNSIASALLLAIVFCMKLLFTYRRNSAQPRNKIRTEQSGDKNGSIPQNLYKAIEPLVDFSWHSTQPIQLRPFKPVYHLTMALQGCTFSELLEVDNTYLDRIKLRRSLVQDQDAVARCNPEATKALDELYRWLMQTYLPTRFPTMFGLTDNANAPDLTKVLHNKVTDDYIPLDPFPDPIDTMKTIAGHIDTDFFILLPSAKPNESGKYVLEAFINCFPSGFDPREKLNQKLADIHGPVPHYGERLENSMDRFFKSLPVGKIVKRHNWSINSTPQLFKLSGQHTYEGEESAKKEVDVEDTFMRCERQTLHRLPESGALVFAFKTYMYPVVHIKEEGNGVAFAEAIDGLTKGNAPKIFVYKSGTAWGESLQSYLRS